MAVGEVASGLESGAGPKIENEVHVQLEFHRTHTLCALSTVSTDCTYMYSDIVGLHCSCSSIAKLAALHVDETWLTVI